MSGPTPEGLAAVRGIVENGERLSPVAALVLLDRIDELTKLVRLVNDQRLYAERCVGSLPLEMGDHFERRRQEVNGVVRQVLDGES